MPHQRSTTNHPHTHLIIPQILTSNLQRLAIWFPVHMASSTGVEFYFMRMQLLVQSEHTVEGARVLDFSAKGEIMTVLEK